MPSRRALLAGLAVGATGGLAGRTGTDAVDGYVQLKAVLGRRDVAGTLREEDVIDVRTGTDETEGDISADIADRWADRVDDPERPTVSKARHNDLRSYYEEVRYIVGVCSQEWREGEEHTSTGCHNAQADREDFNRAQVYDRVRASYSTPNIRIHSVEGTRTFTPE